MTFFRKHDGTGDAVARRQAGTFQILAGLAGHTELPEPKSNRPPSKSPKGIKQQKKVIAPLSGDNLADNESEKGIITSNFGLTVRVEINLPADGSKETYDNIFKSIKENLLGG